MLTQQDNERLTQIGPETPMGRLLRCYWHPIAAATELTRHPTKQVRILGEDLVLYRDGRGKLGLIGAYCAHRRAGLVYGIPETILINPSGSIVNVLFGSVSDLADQFRRMLPAHG